MGSARQKKTRFFRQHFSKSAQKRLVWLLFQKFTCGAENFAKIGAKQCFGRASKINLVDLKKKGRQNFGKFFENPSPPPPRENPRSAPGLFTDYLVDLKKVDIFSNPQTPPPPPTPHENPRYTTAPASKFFYKADGGLYSEKPKQPYTSLPRIKMCHLRMQDDWVKIQ